MRSCEQVGLGGPLCRALSRHSTRAVHTSRAPEISLRRRERAGSELLVRHRTLAPSTSLETVSHESISAAASLTSCVIIDADAWRSNSRPGESRSPIPSHRKPREVVSRPARDSYSTSRPPLECSLVPRPPYDRDTPGRGRRSSADRSGFDITEDLPRFDDPATRASMSRSSLYR